MTATQRQSWTDVMGEVTRRIAEGDWQPGEMIPNEAELAEEFGCSRGTVNRALRSLADQGLLDRRRKAGTRVRALPESRAQISIPVVREQIEQRGAVYGYHLRVSEEALPPAPIAARLAITAGCPALHLTSLHTADGAPFVYEDRWINIAAVPEAAGTDFSAHNANEWLLQNVPLSTGEIALSAHNADAGEAELLGCAPGTALFEQSRTTRYGGATVTVVRLLFAPGYRMSLAL